MKDYRIRTSILYFVIMVFAMETLCACSTIQNIKNDVLSVMDLPDKNDTKGGAQNIDQIKSSQEEARQYISQGKLELALSRLNKGLALCREGGENYAADEIEILQALVDILGDLGDYNQAETYANDLLKLKNTHPSANQGSSIVHTESQLGLLCLVLDKEEESLKWFTEARSHSQGDFRLQAQSTAYMAFHANKFKNHLRALQQAKDALKILQNRLETTSVVEIRCFATMQHGFALLSMGKLDQSDELTVDLMDRSIHQSISRDKQIEINIFHSCSEVLIAKKKGRSVKADLSGGASPDDPILKRPEVRGMQEISHTLLYGER